MSGRLLEMDRKAAGAKRLRIWDSLDERGQVNPVLVWARWGMLLCQYGHTRSMWAINRDVDIWAVVWDVDDRFEGPLMTPAEANALWSDPPVGCIPRGIMYHEMCGEIVLGCRI